MRRRGGPAGRQGPGVVRTMARTAVVAGTATATVGVVGNAMKGGQPEAAAPAPAAPQYVAPSAPSGLSQDQIARLQQIAQLRDQGVLTDAEFQVEKERILRG